MSQPHIGSDGEPTYSTPHWVKVSGIVLIIVALLVAVIFVTDLGGEHGPGRHVPPAGVTEASDTGGHTPPIQHGGQ